MNLRNWFRSLTTSKTITRSRSFASKRNPRCRLNLEMLEDRTVPSVIPNDPGFPQQWDLHNTGQVGGLYDADMDTPAAWSVTTGSTATVVAVLDSGVDYTDPDLYLNIWLNQGEIPAGIRAGLTDVDGDRLITFRDLNAPANASFVTDVNGTGYIDGGDLLHDPRWANRVDEDGNGKVDDLIGWDFHDNDNDPQASVEAHGTYIAKIIGAMSNNGLGTAGINWAVQLMPVRIRSISGANTDLVNADAAAGIDYSVAEGAPISNNSWRTADGGYIFSQEVYDAISRARQAGQLFVAAAGNDGTNNDASPFYPASYDLDNIISATLVDTSGQISGTNYGANTVDLGVFATGGSSSASAHATGVAALLKSLHPDWSYAQIKDRILSTVDPLPSLAGKTVTGGTLNAAVALATTSITVSNPTVTEGDSGTTQLIFTVTRHGDDTGTVTLNWSTANGTATAGSDYVAASGQVTFLPSGGNTQTININVKGDLIAEADETFFVNLSVASGSAVLADEQAQGSILDNDTKFYVVNDGSSDRTYEYGLVGQAMENYALNSGDTAPRGVATTAAGTKVWVVDANKTVYVYNTSGGLLGSWTAGSLTSAAQVEGIATNGTDIWLLDNGADKVYKYTGAASRLSGSQNAASSFNLANGKNGNANGKGIVTDGTFFWVVDDSTTDKVFKYTLSGSSLGSWAIDPANASPTGLTINPANVSDIWIVDNGTGKVYQYTAAAGRTSGSQNAAATFALAAGNTNPQDIADPPPATMLLAPAASSVALKPPSVPAVNATASTAVPIAAAVPSLAGRDALFIMLARESFQSPAVPSIDLMVSGTFTSPVGSSAPVADSALALAGAFSGQTFVHQPTLLTPWTNQEGLRSDRPAFGLLDGIWADPASQPSAAATDSFFAMLADDASTAE